MASGVVQHDDHRFTGWSIGVELPQPGRIALARRVISVGLYLQYEVLTLILRVVLPVGRLAFRYQGKE